MTVEEMIRRVYEVLPGEQPVRLFKWQDRGEMESVLRQKAADGDNCAHTLHFLLSERTITYVDSSGAQYYNFGGGNMNSILYDSNDDGQVNAADSADSIVWALWK